VERLGIVKHLNSGSCPKCMMIMNRYSGTTLELRHWFESFQSRHPEAHVSCAARDEIEQEELFRRKASRAHFGQSAHNFGAALDIFEMSGNNNDIYERYWFLDVLKPELPEWIIWYGEAGAEFPELPHIELRGWRDMVASGQLKLVKGAA
jgi:hypothetical protein